MNQVINEEINDHKDNLSPSFFLYYDLLIAVIDYFPNAPYGDIVHVVATPVPNEKLNSKLSCTKYVNPVSKLITGSLKFDSIP